MATADPLNPASVEDLVPIEGVPPARLRERVEKETREIETDCRVAVHCHARAGTMWNYLYYLLGLPTTVLATLAGISAFNDKTNIATGFAVAAAISAAANTFLNAGQIATAHAKKRSEYEQLKNEIRHFRNITLELDHPLQQVVGALKHFSHRRDVLNLESPQVSNRSYRRAKLDVNRKTEEEAQRAEQKRRSRAPGE